MAEDTFRRSTVQDEMSEAEGIDYEPSVDLEEETHNRRMAEKIRDQAVRLNQLEVENSMLKKRMNEQSFTATRDMLPEPPAHPKPNPEVQDLKGALNAEVLLNEEQRAYIEILKSALESKMEDLGFKHRNVDAFSEMTMYKEETDVSRKEAAKLSSMVSNLEFQIARQAEKLSHMTQDQNEANEKHDVIESDLNNSIQALQMAQDEINRLQDEQTRLLSSVEELNFTINTLKGQNRDLSMQMSTLTGQGQRQTGTIDQLTSQMSKLENEIREKDNEIEAEKQTLYELHSQLQQYANELEQVQQQNKREQDNASRIKAQLEREVASLKELNSNIQTHLSQTTESLETAKTAHTDASCRLTSRDTELKTVQGKNEALQGTITALNGTLKETQGELDSLRSDHDRATQELSALRSLTQTLQERLNDGEHKSITLSSQISELSGRLVSKKTKLRDVKSFNNTISRDLNIKTSDKNNLQALLKETEQNLYTERTKLQSLEMQVKSLANESDDFRNKSNALESLNAEKNQALVSLQHERDDLVQRFESTKRELDDTQFQLHETQRETDEVLSCLKIKESEFMSTHTELKQMETKLASKQYSGSLVEEENRQLKYRCEELTKDMSAQSQSLHEKERESRDRFMELESYRKQMGDLSHTLESAESKTRRLKEDLAESRRAEELERQERQTISSQHENYSKDINKILQILQLFSNNTQALLSTSNRLNDVVSNGVKEILPRLATTKLSRGDLSVLVEWIGVSCDEIEGLVRRVADLKLESQTTAKQVVDIQEARYREAEDRDRVYGSHLESSAKEHSEHLREIAELQSKEMELRRDNEVLVSKLHKLNDNQNEQLQEKFLEERERKNIETLLQRVIYILPSAMQRAANELHRLQKEQTATEREKARLETQMATIETDVTHVPNRREIDALRERLSTKKRELQMYQRSIVNLEDEMTKLDANERRKSSYGSDLSIHPYEDQIRQQSVELERTRYEKTEIEQAYNTLLTEKYNLEMEVQNSVLSKSPLKRRPPSVPSRYISSGKRQ